MAELLDITPKIIDHWQQYKEQCEGGVARAEKELARIALITSGQLELEITFEETTI
jgi:hypothetical protein